MPKAKLLKLVPRTHAKGCIEYAEAMLRRCQSGETISFTCVESHPGDKYSIHCSPGKSCHRIAGELLDAAIGRLGYGADRED